MLTSPPIVMVGADAWSGVWVLTWVLVSLAVRVALDVALVRSRDGERAGRDVLGDDRPSGSVGTVAEGDRRDERRVDGCLDAGPDRRPVLGLGLVVVVGRDRGGAEV